MRAGALLAATLGLSAACAAPAAVPVVPAPVPTISEATRLVARADEMARDGQAQQARQLYEQVVGQHRDDPVRSQALLGLARLHVDPAGGLRDLRAADTALQRLLADYPQSPGAGEARAWRAVVQELAAREADGARMRADLERLRGDIERVRTELDRSRAEAEQARLERERLRTDLERLKRLDMELERRR